MVRIVGVVRDGRFAGWGFHRPVRPTMFVPLAQSAPYKDKLMQRVERGSHFVGGVMLVTSLPPSTLEPLLTRTLAQIDSNLSIVSVRTMREQVDLVFRQERAVAGLAGLFGLVALLLAAVGMYGVSAYNVARRSNDMGVRLALGAARVTVVQWEVAGGFRRFAIGLV